ncbi:MAG: hypothetical protein QM760_06820 [Nibricoccus sp.]
MNDLPEGWTDDMRMPITPAQSEAMVDYVFEALLAFRSIEDASRELVTRFSLTSDDALLALDRVPGGVVRALTANPANCPNREKDPLAYLAFQRVWAELPRKHFFSRQKKAGGRWIKWFEDRRKLENGK